MNFFTQQMLGLINMVSIHREVTAMKIEEKVKTKLEQLIEEGRHYTSSIDNYGRLVDQFGGEDKQKYCDYKGWTISAENLVRRIFPDDHNPYPKSLAEYFLEPGFCVYSGEITSILKSLLGDIEAGLISSIEDQTKAIVFDEFLDHAKDLFRKKQKEQAGVIAGVAFEDTFRNICRKNGISDKNVNLDQLISELVKKTDRFTQIKAKRARSAAHVRTKASHAEWDEFELNDVKSTIEITEDLVKSFLE